VVGDRREADEAGAGVNVSVYGRTYIARIAPCATTWREAIYNGQDVIQPGGEIRCESFAEHAFAGVEAATVPVILWHDTDRPVGTLSSLIAHKGWHLAAFTLDPTKTLSCIAADSLRHGSAVSIGFARSRHDPLLAEDGTYWYQEAVLTELAVLAPHESPAYRGAVVTQVLEPTKASPAAVSTSRLAAGEEIVHDEGKLLVRPGSGQVLRIR